MNIGTMMKTNIRISKNVCIDQRDSFENKVFTPFTPNLFDILRVPGYVTSSSSSKERKDGLFFDG